VRRRLTLILLGVTVLAALGLLSSIVTQGFQDLARAEDERQRLERDRERLERRISELETTLEAVRNDPEAVESLARRELGWIRPDEKILIIASPTPPPPPISLTDPTPTPILSLRD